MRVIITGATGMVGEGVLFECLQNANVSAVLIINRRHYEMQHPKLTELIVPDFFKLDEFADSVKEYDACFFCAGVSSIGKKEAGYTKLTYDMTLAFAKALSAINNQMVFTYVSGSHTDSSERGKLMWARVKGKTENDLMKLPFKGEYNFRPGVMMPFDGQKNWNAVFKFLGLFIRFVAPKSILSMHEVGVAMINCVQKGYAKKVLEVSDIRTLSKI